VIQEIFPFVWEDDASRNGNREDLFEIMIGASTLDVLLARETQHIL
jgi:hypothetical protein